MGKNRTLFRQGGTVLLRNGQRISDDNPYFSKHLTDANGDFAIKLIEKFAAEDKPFFLNIWWLIPHKPYEPAPQPHWSRAAADSISDDQYRFRSMVQHMRWPAAIPAGQTSDAFGHTNDLLPTFCEAAGVERRVNCRSVG